MSFRIYFANRRCFNSRVRGGRDALRGHDKSTGIVVSTHASAGDATSAMANALTIAAFQLTRPRGTRPLTTAGLSGGGSFNSRVRGGRDIDHLKKLKTWMFQLTRPRGTRPSAALPPFIQTCFNSRVRGGRDWTKKRLLSEYRRFNSRVRGGRDGKRNLSPNLSTCFNSRVRGGRDEYRYFPSQITGVSTHASAGDATRGLWDDASRTMFQLTRPRGTRRAGITPSLHSFCFNSRVRGGRDVFAMPFLVETTCFNSRVRGGRDGATRIMVSPSYVSTHASAGDATCIRLLLRFLDSRFNSRVRGGRDAAVLSFKFFDCSFNSRVRGGRDLASAQSGLARQVSTHASAGDATIIRCRT